MSRRNARANHVNASGGYGSAPLGGGGWPITGRCPALAVEWAKEQAEWRPSFRDEQAHILPVSSVGGNADGLEAERRHAQEMFEAAKAAEMTGNAFRAAIEALKKKPGGPC